MMKFQALALSLTLAFLSSACWANDSDSLSRKKSIRIGILDVRLEKDAEAFRAALARRLELVGVATAERKVELVVERVTVAGGSTATAARLFAVRPDILFAANETGARALATLTKTVPIIFQSYSDPLENGLVRSLTQPDANLTGFSFFYKRLHIKRWEMLRQIHPKMRHLAVFLDQDFVPAGILEDVATARRLFGIEVTPWYVVRGTATSTLARELRLKGVDAIDLPHAGHFTMRPRQTVADIMSLKLPASFDGDTYCSFGGTLCYARENTPAEIPAAAYIKFIVDGARPGDLPVSFPSRFDLAFNITSLRALNLRPPHALMMSARIYE